MGKKFYRCDPDKNKPCKKTMCFYLNSHKSFARCKATENPEYAVRNVDGTPIVEFETRGENNGTD